MSLNQLTILAPGLLGASVARAARARGSAKRIVIWARNHKVQQAVAGQAWCDRAAATIDEAVRDADLIVIAATPEAIVPLAREADRYLKPGAIVTDVGSVKTGIVREAQTAVSRGRFVGSHPMAGSQKTGWENGTAELFVGRTCFVTPLPGTDVAAADAVEKFWSGLGAVVVRADPETHDRIVAHISHLPQLVASSLCAFLSTRDPRWRSFAGNGLRDTTRIAGSDPKLWKTILEQNRGEVLEALRGFQLGLSELEKALEKEDWPAVVAALEQGKAYREGLS